MEGCQVAFGASFKTQLQTPLISPFTAYKIHTVEFFWHGAVQARCIAYSKIIRDMIISLFQNITFSLRKLRIEDRFALVFNVPST